MAWKKELQKWQDSNPQRQVHEKWPNNNAELKEWRLPWGRSKVEQQFAVEEVLKVQSQSRLSKPLHKILIRTNIELMSHRSNLIWSKTNIMNKWPKKYSWYWFTLAPVRDSSNPIFKLVWVDSVEGSVWKKDWIDQNYDQSRWRFIDVDSDNWFGTRFNWSYHRKILLIFFIFSNSAKSHSQNIKLKKLMACQWRKYSFSIILWQASIRFLQEISKIPEQQLFQSDDQAFRAEQLTISQVKRGTGPIRQW